MKNIAIKVDKVSKHFKLPHEKNTSIKSLFLNIFRGGRTFEKQKVLEDISLEIQEGEFFGILGRNGSGKSTLLKLLAGIYSPDEGHVQVNGNLTPFIELGVGFNPELTGRENVYLNGALLGFDRRQMESMYDEIVEFAELERFMDQKLKNYSSGMQVRLAFSIAIRAKSDILLIDEVLAVGDAAFQRKCLDYFGDLKKNKQTVVFVSHDMESVRKYCDRALLIDKGAIRVEGDTEKVIKRYMKLFMNNDSLPGSKDESQDLPLGMSTTSTIERETVDIKKVWTEDGEGEETAHIKQDQDYFYVNFEIKILKKTDNIVPGVIITNPQGEFISASNSQWVGQKSGKLKAGDTVTASFKLPNIYEQGDYRVSVNVVDASLLTFYAWKNEELEVNISRKFATGGKINPNYEVRLIS